MSKEIEVKIQILPAQLLTLMEWLSENASFQEQVHHKEYYLDNPQSPFCSIVNGLKDASSYLRIRLTEEQDSICLKDWVKDPNDPFKHTHCEEYETKLDNGYVMLELLQQLGYTEVTVVEKHRKKYLDKDFEIVIDDVANLGIFVEIEYKGQTEDVKKATAEIYNFLKTVGITKFREQTRGYVSMLWNPTVDFGEEVNL